jgi:hypothetical protein
VLAADAATGILAGHAAASTNAEGVITQTDVRNNNLKIAANTVINLASNGGILLNGGTNKGKITLVASTSRIAGVAAGTNLTSTTNAAENITTITNVTPGTSPQVEVAEGVVYIQGGTNSVLQVISEVTISKSTVLNGTP